MQKSWAFFENADGNTLLHYVEHGTPEERRKARGEALVRIADGDVDDLDCDRCEALGLI